MSAEQEPWIDWEPYRAELHNLYLVKERTLEDVMIHMQRVYGVHASKAQYETQFKKWEFRKNLTSDEWDYIGRSLQKRKFDGKCESDVYFKGRLIPRKKVKREVSRRCPPVCQQLCTTVPSPPPPETISILTPNASMDSATSPPNLPQLQESMETTELNFTHSSPIGSSLVLHDQPLSPTFDGLSPYWNSLMFFEDDALDSQIGANTMSFFGGGSILTQITPPDRTILLRGLPWIQFRELIVPTVSFTPSRILDDIFPPRSEHATSMILDWENSMLPRNSGLDSGVETGVVEFIPSLLSIPSAEITQRDTTAPEGVTLASNTLSSDEGRKLLAGWFGSTNNADIVEPLSQFRRQMETYSLERYDGELSAKLNRLFNASNGETSFQILEFALYLISNNLLLEEHTDHFLKWVIERKHDPTLISCLKAQMPTVHAFATKILESALRIGDSDFLQLLIDSGIDTSSFNGIYGGKYLQKVCGQGNTKIAQILLDHGADVNVPVCGKHRTTAIQAATRMKNLGLVQILIQAGANIDAPAFTGGQTIWTPKSALSQAINDDNVALVHILIDAGADVKNCRVKGQDAVQWAEHHANDEVFQILSRASGKKTHAMSCDGILKAAALGGQELSQYLREKGEDVKSSAREILESALFTAVSRSSYFAAASLLELGVDPGSRLKGHSALEQAVGRGDIELVEMLLDSGADVNTSCVLEALDVELDPNLDILRLLLNEGVDVKQHGGEALRNAAMSGNLEAVQLLLISGADVNAPVPAANDEGAMALHYAVGNVELIRILLRAGADINAIGHPTLGKTALQVAAESSEMSSVKELLKAGADVNTLASRDGGCTALQAAASQEDIELLRTLLDAGANVNASAAFQYGATALQAAAQGGNVQILKILLEAGADVNAPGSKIRGITALQAAIKRRVFKSSKRSEFVNILLAAGADLNAVRNRRKGTTILQSAIKRGDVESVQLLLKAGANANSIPKGKQARSPIQQAAETGNECLVKVLLEAGADVNAAAGIEYGRTALQAAASAETPNMELIEVILAAGADINAPPGPMGGVTALQGAAIRGYVKIALRLLAAGADVNAASATFNGRTALDGAAEHGHLDMVKILLNAGAAGDISAEKRFDQSITLAKGNGHFAVVRLLGPH